MKTIFSTVALFFSASLVAQPSLITRWGYSYGNHCGINTTCRDIQTDLSGNHITTGSIYESQAVYAADLDPSGNVFPSSTNVPNDVFIATYDPNGNFVSGIVFGGPGGDVGMSLTVDNGNNILITGIFNGTADFDPSPATSTIASVGAEDIFIAKYTNAGALLWVRAFGSTTNDRGIKVLTDNQNNVFLTANFTGTMDIDPSPVVNNLVSNGGVDVCLIKLNASGNLVAGVSFGNAGVQESVDIALDQNKKLYATGLFDGTVDFDPDPVNTFTLSNITGSADTYVAKFDSLLVFQWAKSATNSNIIIPRDINIDNSGNILLCGHFNFTTVDLDLSPVSTATFAAASGKSAFVAKYDSDGNYLWAGVFGNSDINSNITASIWSDNTGTIYSLGTFGSVVDFDLSSVGSYTIANGSAGPALYMSRYTSNGSFISASKLSSGYIYPFSAHMDGSGQILVSGNMNNPVMLFPNTSLPLPDQCGNYFDAFISKFQFCTVPVVNSVTSSTNNICPVTGSVVLSVSGTLNDATNWTWAANSCSGASVGVGTSVTVSPLANTVYYVKGTGNCAGNSLNCYSVNINTLPVPVMTLTAANAACPGKAFTLTASGSNTYTWSNGSTGPTLVTSASVTTTFSASTTATNGCVATNTITQTVFTVAPVDRKAVINFYTVTNDPIDSLCTGANINIVHTAGTVSSYSCTGCSTYNNGSGFYLTYLNLQSTAVYSITSVDPGNGCDNGGSYTITVMTCTGLAELDQSGKILLFPNPASGLVNVQSLAGEINKVVITNVLGQQLRIVEEVNIRTLDLTLLSAGMYYVGLYNQAGRLLTQRIVKE